MKRFHVNVGVSDLQRAVAFYSELFGDAPSVQEADYARWMLEDPRVNFAISTRVAPGLDHLGVQTETDEELAELRQRLSTAEMAVLDQPDVVCCYARGSKAWVQDPDGLSWETFLTRGPSTTYGDGISRSGAQQVTCCAATDPAVGREPAAAAASCCGP